MRSGWTAPQPVAHWRDCRLCSDDLTRPVPPTPTELQAAELAYAHHWRHCCFECRLARGDHGTPAAACAVGRQLMRQVQHLQQLTQANSASPAQEKTA